MESGECRKDRDAELSPVPENASEETSRSQNLPGPPRKRVYQSRRNSRACDACRSRKTKTTIKDLNEKLKTADARLQSPTSTFSSKTTNRSSSSQSPRSPSPEQPRRFSFSSTGENFFLGSASTMSFVESLRGYTEGLGYDASLLDARGPSEETPHALSTSPYSDTLQIRDLRALLPTQSNGERFLMIFYQYLKRYMPAMCWCVIQQKFERAYRAPVFAEDRSSVTGIFCVLMTINAYASICSDDSDIFEVPNYSSKRGWYFLEFAKNFHDLNRPTHSLFDVEDAISCGDLVLVIMAMYLESVALPYPLRLTVEYLAKVCKDIGLHRKSTYEEIDIDEPGHNYTGDLTNEHANGGMSMEMPESIILTRSLTSISRLIGPIFRLVPQAHDAEHRLSHIEQQLDFFESNFPQGILAWESSTPLDPVLLDAAIFAMAIRLSLYRFFTDACLNPDFRARCLLQCLEVAKATVHLLRRTIKFPNWEENFRLRQCGLTYQHIFKTSTILLIAAAIFPKPVDTSSELRTCIGVLQIAAPTRPLVLQNLHTLDKLSEIMKQTPATALYRNLRAATLATIPPHISSKATVHLPEKSYFLTAPSLTATIPSNAPILASYKTGGSQVPLTLPSNDIPFRARVESPLGPNYKFPNIAAACPALENNIWLNQVDLPSWALMQTVLQQGDLR
ncbi:hypothetical protein TWF970_006514 [Orbilia oligospora]|uniref:Transcription factor domain-containing protein n=1 Tax=Orbilia oligospora TaxID=2813651 RepID=A0A7C8VLE5_ORBOL|nr:hypothetical protein TWF970_006514 [Orbilia oligospora]